MLDLELLRSFVSVVDAGGFTRAGERVHRTQSTVSQQIKRLEDDVGQPLLNRNGKDVTPTEAGERLLSYARRLLALAEEARDVLARPEQRRRGPAWHPRGFRRLSAGETAGGVLALASRPAARRPRRSEHVSASAISNAANSIWRCSSARPARKAASRCGRSACTGSPARAIRVDTAHGSVPLIGFPTGLPLPRAARSMRWKAPAAPGTWPIPVSNLAGIQAAVAAGMGLSILSEIAIQADHRVLTAKDGFAPIDRTEVALVAAPDASPATLRLADRLAEFCDTVQAKAA